MENTLQNQINLKQLSPNSFQVSSHKEWSFANHLLGGTVAAQLFHVAATYFQTDCAIKAKKQPDVHTMHIEYLHPCEQFDSVVTVLPLRVGAISSTIQLQLMQNDKLKVVALATSTNFDVSIGPSAATGWTMHPPALPAPDFKAVLDKKPVKDWIPVVVQGEIFPMTQRMVSLLPRKGHGNGRVVDAWIGYRRNEYMHSLHVALLADMLPSLSDTLLKNNGLYDAHANHAMALEGAQKKPGEFAIVENTIADAMKLKVFNSTTCLDIEFKKRLPAEGTRFVFQRVATDSMVGGRMGIDITLCDENMDVLCTAKQAVLVVDIGRRLQGKSKKPKASL